MALYRVEHSAKGAGVVAAKALPEGAVVALFEGPIIPFAEIPDSEWRHVLWLADERWMVPGSPGRFLNHSCAPNCTLRGRPGGDACDIVTTRAVAEGEELTISYDRIRAADWVAHESDPAYRFWHPSWTFDCLCGAPSCRGRIDSYVIVGDIETARRARHRK